MYKSVKMKCGVVIFLCLLLKGSFTLNSNLLGNTKGAQVFRVIPEGEKELQFLEKIYRRDICDFWSFPRIAGKPIYAMSLDWMVNVFKNMLDTEEIKYEIVIDDVKTYIDDFKEKNDVILTESRNAGYNMSWDSYHPYEDVIQWMEGMAKEYSSLMSVLNFGKTFEKRAMKLLKLSVDTKRKPVIWIDAGIHGREWLGPATATFIINELMTNSEIKKEVTEILNHLDIYFVPVANPDGYVYSWNNARLWSKNRYDPKLKTSCTGVDIGRNWDFHWNEVENMTNVCSDHYPGEIPFSEIETRSIRDQFIRLFPDIKFYISLHSFGQNWFSPWSYTDEAVHDEEKVISLVKKVTAAMQGIGGSMYSYGPTLNKAFHSSGTLTDWAKGVAGVKYSFQVDLPDEGKFGFFLPPEKIKSVGEEMLEAIRYIYRFTKEEYAQETTKDEL